MLGSCLQNFLQQRRRIEMVKIIEQKVKESIQEFLFEVIEYPMSYFSEKALQLKLSSKLLKHQELSSPIQTSLYQRFCKQIDRIMVSKTILDKSLSISPLQMEFGVDIEKLPYRMDIAILNPKKIKNIDSWQFQEQKKYLRPLIGIELGTEKTGWGKMSKEHLDNDEVKLSTAEKGYIINVMRNTNVCQKGTVSYKNKERQIDKFKDAILNKRKNGSKTNWIALISHIGYQEIEIFDDNNWSGLLSVVNDMAKIKQIIDSIK